MNEIEDEKLLIFGWITTVFGLPPKANPDKYNELTDKLHKLFSDLIKQSQLDLIEKIEGSLGKKKPKMSFVEASKDYKLIELATQNHGYNIMHDEVTTILKQVREGL